MNLVFEFDQTTHVGNLYCENTNAVLSKQNDIMAESGESAATDLISALKEFEETTAKITSAHQQTINNDCANQTTTHKTIESISDHYHQADERGPIEFFNRTKETLRHVPQINHHNGDVRSNNDSVLKSNSSSNDQRCENDGNETEEDYVKIPVQQLINTFEKQMRSIIKQKINENIQLKLDGTAASSNNNVSATYTTISNSNSNTSTNTNRIYDQCDNGNMNESRQLNDHDTKHAYRQSVDYESMVCQQQQQQQQQRQTTTNQIECHEMQSTFVESATSRFSNSNETKADIKFDGGKAHAIYNTINPTRLHHSYLFVDVTLTIHFSCVLYFLLVSIYNFFFRIWHTKSKSKKKTSSMMRSSTSTL